MKKLICLLLTIVLFYGCDHSTDWGNLIPGETQQATLPELLHVAMADESLVNDAIMSRTHVGEDGKTIFWSNGDKISYFASNVHNAGYKFEGEDSTDTAEFYWDSDGFEDFELKRSYAVYPYAVQASCVKKNGMERLLVNFPAEQTYAPNSFGKDANVMVAMGEDNMDSELYFYNACGCLVIKLYGEDVKVKKIELMALNGEKIAGQGIIKPNYDASPDVEMSDESLSAVTLDCGEGVELGADAQHATEFWFTLPPVIFENGFKIKATPVQGDAFEMQTSKEVDVTCNNIQPMAAVQFMANAQSDHQLIYTRANGTEPLKFYNDMPNPFDATITAHYYDAEKKHFVIEFDAPLTTIKENAFRGKNVNTKFSGSYSAPSEVTDITSVIFPKSLTTIGSCAFAGTALRELTIPGNVTLVDYYAFWECRDLADISIPEGDEPLRMVADATASGKGMFGLSKLSNIRFNRDIEYYDHVDGASYDFHGNGESVFSLSYCSDATDFPGYVSGITIEIGPNVTRILPYMFAYRGIQSITIPESITSIGDNAFWHCYKLESINIPSSVSTLGNDVFKYCIKMKSAVLGASTVGERIFYECASLESVTIKGTVNSMGNDVFSFDRKLKTLTFEPSDANKTLLLGYQTFATDQEGPFYDAVLETVNWNRNISYRLHNEGGLDSDDEGLFSQKTKLTHVTIGEQVKSIPPYTFANSKISSVTIPDGVTAIGDYAFYNCDALTSVSFNAATMGNNVFDDCNNLTSVTIKGGVNSIGKHAFQGCKKLHALTFEPSPTAATLTIDYQGEEQDKKGPFYNCPLDYVYINRDVKLAKSAILSRYESLFGDKPNLKQVTLGEQVKKLHAYEFSASGLTSITIPSTLASIGDNAFLDCTSLATVNIEESNSPLTIAYQLVRTIAGTAFMSEYGPFYDSPLASITLKREINYVKEDGTPFKPDEWDEGLFANKYYNKEDLTTQVNLGGKLTAISDWMFSGVRMQQMRIPEGITSIGKEAFAYCYMLQGLICDHTNPPALGNRPFLDCGKKTDQKKMSYISVKKEAKDNFLKANGWKEYKDIITEWTPTSN